MRCQNHRAKPGNPYWKHRMTVPHYAKEVLQVSILKHPYTWVESVLYRAKPGFIKDGSYPYPTDTVEGLSQIYRDWVISFCCTPSPVMGVVFRYETLLEDTPGTLITGLRMMGDIIPDNDHILVPEAGSIYQSASYTPDMEEYYRQTKPKFLTEEEQKTIRMIVGDTLMEGLKYEY